MRLDVDPKYSPDYLCNAEKMIMIPDNTFKMTHSDTPYNTDAASKYYGKAMLDRSKVLREMNRITKVGGLIAILDQITTVSPPRNLKVVARIGITSVPNLDMRFLTVLKKEREHK